MQSISLFFLFWGAVISGEFKSTAPVPIEYNFRKDGAVIVNAAYQGNLTTLHGTWEEIPQSNLRVIADEFSEKVGDDVLRVDALFASNHVIILSFGEGAVLNDIIYEVKGGDWVFFKSGFRLIKK